MKKDNQLWIVGVIVGLFVLAMIVAKCNFAVTIGDPLPIYKKSLGEKASMIDKIDVWKVGPIYFSKVEFFDLPEPTISREEGDGDKEVLEKLVETMRKFSYDEGQPDPMRVEETGAGNCQSFSLFAKVNLDANHVDNKLIVEDTHIYNRVLVNGVWYNVDFAKGTLEEVVDK